MIMKKETFRGLSKIEFIWNGEYSDPEIEYRGKILNYWEIEDLLWESFKENVNVADWDDENYSKWLKDNEDWVYSYLDETFFDD